MKKQITVSFMKEVPMRREDKVKMYMHQPKRRLAEMLCAANEGLTAMSSLSLMQVGIQKKLVGGRKVWVWPNRGVTIPSPRNPQKKG